MGRGEIVERVAFVCVGRFGGIAALVAKPTVFLILVLTIIVGLVVVARPVMVMMMVVSVMVVFVVGFLVSAAPMLSTCSPVAAAIVGARVTMLLVLIGLA